MSDSPFQPPSRYAGIELATLRDDEGEEVAVYLRRRFLPPPERLSAIGTHRVVQGERIDTVAAQELDDPEQYWRICDANRAMRPRDLTEPIGRKLRITLPDGIPGPDDG